MTELAPPLPARPALSTARGFVRAFYIAEVALMSVFVLAGFWPFYADLPGGTVARLDPVTPTSSSSVDE